MKIVHVCLSSTYIDDWGYQENLLPIYLNKLNTENYIITSINDFPSFLSKNKVDEIKKKGTQYKIDNVNIERINTIGLTSSLFIPKGLYKSLIDINPDVIFHHGFNPISLHITAKYVRKYKSIFFVDNHADEINMSKNQLWVWGYHKIFTRLSCSFCMNDVKKFYGVTNSRCDFINKYYKVPKNKIDLLPIGADTDFANELLSKELLRNKYGFQKSDYIIVSGGKMGVTKGTDILIEAIRILNKKEANIKLLLFGKIEDSTTLDLLNKQTFITLHGWCDRLKTLELLKLSDVACWPIHHTTLIEDAISVEIPLLIRKTSTTEHLLDGNGLWLHDVSVEELINRIHSLMKMSKIMLEKDCARMHALISYNNIAKKILDDSKN